MSSSGELRRLPQTADVGANLKRFDCPPHFHETYTVSVFHTPVRIWCRGAFRDVGPGQVGVLEPREVHWGEAVADGCRQDMVDPEPALLKALFGSTEPMRFASPVIEDARLAAELSAAVAATGDDRERMIRAAILRLFETHGTPAPPDAAADPASELTAGAAALLDAPVAALSRRAGISRSHFSRLFHRLCGLSPRDYRRQARVRAARALIEGGAELSAAAAEAGFADQAHMTRQVRSLLGVTPKTLRRS
jgi:AraC-like DNA-binding protein